MQRGWLTCNHDLRRMNILARNLRVSLWAGQLFCLSHWETRLQTCCKTIKHVVVSFLFLCAPQKKMVDVLLAKPEEQTNRAPTQHSQDSFAGYRKNKKHVWSKPKGCRTLGFSKKHFAPGRPGKGCACSRCGGPGCQAPSRPWGQCPGRIFGKLGSFFGEKKRLFRQKVVLFCGKATSLILG